MAAKENAVRVGATLCAVVAGILVLNNVRSCLAEHREYQRRMDNDRVPPYGYVAEDNSAINASKT